ncbi:S8 family peptidase [Yoonia sp.]|uniref:S8 family peptidase n=1 Tax=Yoonia sp. TaxID=2212373 RepID=UPI002FD9928A
MTNLNLRFSSLRPAVRPLVPVFLAVSLSACGGNDGDGGGGGNNPPQVSDNPVLARFFVESFAAFDTAARSLIQNNAKYRRQRIGWYIDENQNGRFDSGDRSFDTYPLHSSGVYYAHAAGLTGAGQIIAITDDGFRASHATFAGKDVDQVGPFSMLDHGTAVASVAAGNSASMIGVAPGADLIIGGFDTRSSTDTLIRARQMGAVAVNNSWGFVDTPVTQSNFDIVFSGRDGRAYLTALKDYAADGVVVFAASNEFDDTRAGLMAALPLLEPDLEAGWLTVINAEARMSGDDVVGATRISAACMEAGPWCLAAEGSWEAATAASNGAYGFWTGTSFAAPMVSGALALLGEAFPDMSPNDLRIRLLASADNSFSGFRADGTVELVEGFFHAYSDEWGHGFLDVKAALLPIGRATATMSDGSAYSLAAPLAIEGGATGDAVSRALQGVSLAVDDALGAGFAIPADALVAQRAQAPVTDALWRNWQGDSTLATGRSYFPDALAVGTVGGNTTFRLMIPDGDAQEASFGLSMGRSFDTGLGAVTVNLSVGHDDGDLFPTWHTGDGTPFVAGEMALVAPLDAAMTLQLGAGFGSSLGETGGAAGSTQFNAASAALVRRDLFAGGDSFALTVTLPVAVSAGRSDVTLPVRTTAGVSMQQDFAIDLAPEERELQIGFSYNLALNAQSDLVLSAAVSDNHGNVSGQRSSGVMVGYRIAF